MLSVLLQLGGSGGGMGNMILIGMLLVMVVFVILPQQRARQKQKKYMEGLSKGDEAVTSSGIHGRIISVNTGTIDLEIDRGVTITIDKSSLSHDPSAQKEKK